MAYWMYRERDGRGDSGSMSMALVPVYDENGKVADVQYVHNARPQVGYVMRVGSGIATKLFSTGLVADHCDHRNTRR